MKKPRILIAIPVLRRPHRAAPVVESIRRATPEGAARILFVGTTGDSAEHDACRATGAELLVLPGEHQPGDYARKINAAYLASDEPLLFLGADDIDFRPGWLAEAERVRAETGAGVIGTNDLGNPRVIRGDHATHCVVARDYVDHFGTVDEPRKVMHEGYVHEFADDEMIGTAKSRRQWAFAADSIVEHLHPSWGKAPTDPLYDAQQARMRASRALYLSRMGMWL